jgi:uncharacterized protein
MNILDFLTNGQSSQLDTNGDGAQRLAANILMQRSELMRSLLDSPRNVSSDCGYPEGYISTELYKSLYDREPVPARVVEVYPKECFQVQPTVFEDESADVVTPFEEAWDALGKQLRGEQSFYQEEESSAIWTYLYDADVKSGIGHYAGILLGIDDGIPLNEPAEMITPTNGNSTRKASSDASRRLLFMRVFGESDMRINSLETDMSSPRYGQPTEYDISLIDPTEFTSLGLGASLPTNRAVVHWTRVVHISEYGVLHTPRMQPVLNRLLDLRKLQGGSAEMYWRGAFPGYAIKTQPQLGADVDINKEDVKQQLTDYSNALQRFLVLMGMDITALAPQVSDPSSQVGVQLDAICIQLGIPKRIFMGSERGELASTQDDAAWNDRLKQRQIGVITPRIIIPVVDRLISLRVLPRPAKGYRVSWPDLTSKSDEEKAGIATQRTQAISVYVAGQLETTLAPMDFWTRIMGFTEDESQSIIANAEEVRQQKEKEQAAKDMEAAKVQAEAQAKMDAAAKTAADTTGTEQTPTAPGSPTSPGKPFGGKGSQSPTYAPPNASVGQPGGSNVGGEGSTPVAHAFDPYQPLDDLDTNAKAVLSGGQWVTIEGRHVYLKGGKIVAGPPDLKGETLASAQVKVGAQTKEGTGKGASEPKAKSGKTTTTKLEASKTRTTTEPTTAPDKEHATPNRGLPDQARPTLHEHEARAIKGYTIYAKELNASLRSGDRLSEMDSKIHEGLTSAFGRAKDFKEPVNVYRGMRLPASDQGAFLKRITEAHAKGEEITIPGYMSTSTSQKEAKAFATAYNFPTRVVLEVKAKRGLDLQSFSYVPEQKEFLLDHNSKFTVGSVKKRGELTYVTLEHR